MQAEDVDVWSEVLLEALLATVEGAVEEQYSLDEALDAVFTNVSVAIAFSRGSAIVDAVLVQLGGLTSDQYIHLVWEPPADDGGLPIAGYVLRISDEVAAADGGGGGAAEPLVQLAAAAAGQSAGYYVTSFGGASLQPGLTLTFEVGACNGLDVAIDGSPVGCGPFAEATLETPVVPPSTLASPILISETATALAVAVLPPASDGGAAVERFELRRVAGSGFEQLTDTLNLTAAEATLVPYTRVGGITYTFSARAVNAAGPGDWSDALVVADDASKLPTAPQNVTVTPTAAKPDSFELTWQLPRLEKNSNASFTVALVPTNGSAVESGGEAIELTVEPSACVGGDETPGTGTSTSTGSFAFCSFVVKGAQPYSAYSVAVSTRSANTAGYSAPAVVAVSLPVGPPQPPDVLALSAVFSTGFGLQWRVPEDNGAQISGYLLSWASADSLVGGGSAATAGDVGTLAISTDGARIDLAVVGTPTCASLPPAALELPRGSPQAYTLSPLSPGASYALRLLACNSQGASATAACVCADGACAAWADCAPPAVTAALVAHTHDVPVTPPAPTALAGAPAAEATRTLFVQWGLPYAHELPLTRAELRVSGSTFIALLGTSTPEVPRATAALNVSGLEPATQYQVDVRVRNSVGWSEWSEVAYLWTAPDAPGAPEAPVCPDEYRGPLSLGVVPGETSDHGLGLIAIDVEAWPTSLGPSTAVLHTFPPSAIAAAGAALLDSGLEKPNAEYSVRTRAANPLGYGAWSETAICSTGPPISPPFPWLLLAGGLAGGMLALAVALYCLHRSNALKILAPKLRKKAEDPEPLKTFCIHDSMPNEEEDPELVMNPILMARIAFEEEQKRLGKKRPGTTTRIGRAGGLRRLGITVDGGPDVSKKKMTAKDKVDHFLRAASPNVGQAEASGTTKLPPGSCSSYV